MKYDEREFFIYRIIRGYIDYPVFNKKLKIYLPKGDMLIPANEIYREYLEKAAYEGALTDKEAILMLCDQGLWDEDKEEQYKVIPDHIEEFQLTLYESTFSKQRRSQMRKYLQAARDKYKELFQTRHSLDHMTISGIANFAKWLYLIGNATYECDQLYDWSDISVIQALNFFQEVRLEDTQLRELAKTEPWSSKWSAAKAVNFSVFTFPFTEEQEKLINWSAMYDNIRESPESPSFAEMQDDDYLDGWLVSQKRKREKDKNRQQSMDKVSDNVANKDEIFIVADNEQDAQKIDDLNDLSGSIIKARRFKYLEKHGEAKVAQLPDMKQKIREEIMERIKNGPAQ